jgi:hypothetical protein
LFGNPAYAARYFFSYSPTIAVSALFLHFHHGVRDSCCAAFGNHEAFHPGIVEKAVGLFEIAAAAGREVEIGLDVGNSV